MVRHEGKLIMNLLSQVGRMYPQAVYFPIRTLYLTLKIEQRERRKLLLLLCHLALTTCAAFGIVLFGVGEVARLPCCEE